MNTGSSPVGGTMNKPLVSCVCVTFGRRRLVNEMLYCFLTQDYENKELIIVNDKADEIFEYDDTRVRIYNLHERFSSLGKKRNYSRELTKGEYIITMDDDDLYYSNHISKLVNFHMLHPEVDIVANIDHHYTEHNEGLRMRQELKCPFNGSCISKKYWDNNKFPDEKSCGEDLDFVENATRKFVDGETTFHYRWGLDVWHISGMSGDGKESYEIVTKTTYIGERKTYQLNPRLSEKAQKHYR